MPELPEVNTVMKLFKAQALMKPIIHVQVRDDYIIKNKSGDEFSDLLIGRHFKATYRQGKYFFGLLDNEKAVLFHLGMTGDIIYYEDTEEEPRHARFIIEFPDSQYVGYNDPRKFSKILYLDDHLKYLEEINLGPDALSISKEAFMELIGSRKGILKGVLLNQKIISGLGNLYIDEICYQAKIHPGSKLENVSARKIGELYGHMRRILRWAVDHNAYYQVYPENWFWKWRNEKETLPTGQRIHKAKIAGRTTYWASGLQKKY